MKKKRSRPNAGVPEETRLSKERWAHLRAIDRRMDHPPGPIFGSRTRRLAKRVGRFKAPK